MSDINPFRRTYRALLGSEEVAVHVIKDQAAGLYSSIDSHVKDDRMRALAKTKLEEAVMWAVKGVTG